MILPDVNVLVYAFREDYARHALYRDWLQSVVDADSAFGISPQVLAAVIRISTNRRIHPQPTPSGRALEFTDVILDRPNCHVLIPGPRHWDIFENLCHHAEATGDLVQDAWYAALAIEHGCEWITLDRDYARFPGLRWRAPF